MKYESEFDELFPDYLQNGEVLADSLLNGEGPLFIEGDSMKTDKLLFSDTISNKIYQFTYGNGVEIFLNNSGTSEDYNPENDIKSYYYKQSEPGSNGLASHPFNKSIIFICEHGDRRVSYLDLTTKKKYSIADRYNEKKFNSPNDIVYSKKTNSLYFTDPPIGLPLHIAKDPEGELGYEGIYQIELNENDNYSTIKSVNLLAKMNRPNGLAFSPDESKLYVSSSDDSNPSWFVFDVSEKGFLENKRKFYNADHLRGHDSEGLPNGIKVDRNGYIYAIGPGGLHLFHPDGRRISFFFSKIL